MTMRKSISILLVMVALTMIGCASGDAGNSAEPVKANSEKSDGVTSERQKAIDWVSKNNTWGSSTEAGTGVANEVVNFIDKAIQNKENVYIALGSGIVKDKRATMLVWKNNRFSNYIMTNKEVREMNLEEMDTQKGRIKN